MNASRKPYVEPDLLAPAPSDRPAAEAPPAPRAKPASAVPRYRVVVRSRALWNGQTVWLNEGDVLSDESYGPGGIAQLIACGAQLEKLP